MGRKRADNYFLSPLKRTKISAFVSLVFINGISNAQIE